MSRLRRGPGDATIGGLTVRPAAVADAAGIASVHTVSWTETYADVISAEFLSQRRIDPQFWVERLDMIRRPGSRTAVFVAATAADVVGFCAVGPDIDVPAGRLYSIYLLRAWQQRGIGHELHRRGVSFLAAAGFDQAVLDVLDTNGPAIRFYEREGWVPTGRLKTDDTLGIALREREYQLELGSLLARS